MINSKKKQFCKIYGFCTKSIFKVTKKLLFLQKIEKTQGICYLTIFSKRWCSRYNKNSTFCKSWWHLLLTHDFFCQIIFCSYIFSHFDTLFLFDFGVSEGIADLFKPKNIKFRCDFKIILAPMCNTWFSKHTQHR